MGQVSDDVSDLVRVEINTEVEAYPVLSIRAEPQPRSSRPDIEIPAAMLARLADAERQVQRAELDIMRYVADRYDEPAVREWLAEQDE